MESTKPHQFATHEKKNMETPSKKMHLLLVEDSPFQVASIRNQLSEQFEVECIDCLAKLHPILFDKKMDIILLDLHLPDSQGLQTYLDCRTQDSIGYSQS